MTIRAAAVVAGDHIFLTTGDDSTRRPILLQNAAFLPMCRQALLAYNVETRLLEYANLSMTSCQFLQASPLSDRLLSP